MKIKYSKESKLDLKEISDFISNGSRKYARIELENIHAFIAKLKDALLIGKPFIGFQAKKVRTAIFKNYLIFYEIISREVIQILTIHHHARSLSRNPALGDEE
ncbi:type II toxin-antitoxin system RelE/ParE family toxin [Mucilaginibacter ginkgonis]|uniref:Type II toxin-antitoxin system RelE/ParE family toxin n=1 Tax=Mucilaginibacter ginkgonis TaxID=2682091 RepID=A0A7T7JFW0_9SPHI|nr:type II toxin-antitoxin system RelE/ParE family toxin [Mucilaginibacter ginkgonis]QQL48867.1 type II toxin-antitoxin system RelE/ParE family toxin [Mucilaginibacter ginkgonis]